MRSAARIRMRFVAPLRLKSVPAPMAGDISFLPMEAIGDDGTYDHESVRPSSKISDAGYTYFEEGDVVRARVTPCFENGKGALLTSLTGGRGLGSTELFVFRPSAQIVDRFLFYVTASQDFTERGAATIYGAHGVRRVDEQFARNYRVWLPPLAAQRAIADYLDRETARIDALIAAKRRMMELLEAEFRSMQVAILTGEHYNSRRKHPTFGSLPSHWSSRRAKFCTGGITVGVVVNPSTYFVDDGIPFVHGTDVREGFIETIDRKMLSAESNAILVKSQLRTGDVVAMRVGYPGRAAIVPQELDGANCASVLIFRRSTEMRPELICEFLNSPLGRAQIEAVQYGAAQEVMNVSDAVDLRLPVPPVAEQAMLATQLGVSRARWRKMCALLDRSVILLQERRQALITGAVTGRLDIPEAA